MNIYLREQEFRSGREKERGRERKNKQLDRMRLSQTGRGQQKKRGEEEAGKKEHRQRAYILITSFVFVRRSIPSSSSSSSSSSTNQCTQLFLCLAANSSDSRKRAATPGTIADEEREEDRGERASLNARALPRKKKRKKQSLLFFLFSFFFAFTVVERRPMNGHCSIYVHIDLSNRDRMWTQRERKISYWMCSSRLFVSFTEKNNSLVYPFSHVDSVAQR